METVAPPVPPHPPLPYEPQPDVYDEMLGDDGPRRAWRHLASELAELGPEVLRQRWARGRQLLHDNGVTYTAAGEAGGGTRSWQLDPVPLMLGADEWAGLSAAVEQRARLMDALLGDLYGQQRTLADGTLPPTVVMSRAGFLRPMVGVDVPGDVRLHVHAVDLARSPDGRWWATGDRTQTPAGMGYAAENRLALTRTLPDVFADCGVRRLTGFFDQFRRTLQALAEALPAEATRGRRGPARVVLLSPGPGDTAAFEHAFLARQLGVDLVEAGDLTVRDDQVLLRTLGGLLPVDVILRRTADALCDPLELSEATAHGVPGLVSAVRAGTVAVANALGSGIAESPALVPFLPNLCRSLLGEELRVSSVATWWCGQEAERQVVLRNLPTLVLRRAGPEVADFADRGPVFGHALDEAGLAYWRERIARRPQDFVAQEQVSLSAAPVWTGGGERAYESRHVMLRAFAVARGDGTYHVLPGGLTRVDDSEESIEAAAGGITRAGGRGGSKDTWVLAGPDDGDERLPRLTMTRRDRATQVSRGDLVLPSRTADNMLWLGRHVERAEFGLRLTRAVGRLLGGDVGLVGAHLDRALRRLLRLPGPDPKLPGTVPALGDPATTARRLLARLVERRAGSPPPVVHDLRQARRIGGLVRDRIGDDAWRVIVDLSDLTERFAALPEVDDADADGVALRLEAALDFADETLVKVSAFDGQIGEGMTRERGWRFLKIGRRIERATHLAALLAWALDADGRAGGVGGPNLERRRLTVALDVANSTITHRNRYLAAPRPAAVLDLLLLDEANPRSVAYQLAALERHVAALPLVRTAGEVPPEERAVRRARSDVTLAEIRPLVEDRARLTRLLRSVPERLQAADAALSAAYLRHSVARPQRQAVTSLLDAVSVEEERP